MNKDQILQQQILNQDKLNALLESATQSLLCGPECQKDKIKGELKQKYLDAQTNVQTAPLKLEETKKNYYVFSEGQAYYSNMQEEELTKKADDIANQLSEIFNNEVKNAQIMNSYLNTALINSGNTVELYNKYLDSNNTLDVSLRNSHGDILTNDRKTYYETDALNRLNLWYKFMWYIYYLLVITIIISLLASPIDMSRIKKIAILAFIIFYPYFINPVFTWLRDTFNAFYSNLPKNVYNNL